MNGASVAAAPPITTSVTSTSASLLSVDPVVTTTKTDFIAPKEEEAKRSSRFSFAFDDERFSDRVLVLTVPNDKISAKIVPPSTSSLLSTAGAYIDLSVERSASIAVTGTIHEFKHKNRNGICCEPNLLPPPASSFAVNCCRDKKIKSLDEDDDSDGVDHSARRETTDPDDRNDDVVHIMKAKKSLASNLCSTHLLMTDGDNNHASSDLVVCRLNVNSVVLASDSRFFKAMFTNGMLESQSKEIRLEVFKKKIS